jgi:epoxide hydrolase-like predicted phosphatase
VAISVVCFDLGGVVVRIHGGWEQAVAAAGLVGQPPATWSDRDTVTAWQKAHLSHHRGDLSSAQYFNHVSALSKGHYAPADVELIHRSWLIEEYPGMASVVAQLTASGYLTACLSNTNDHHWRHMLGDSAYPTVCSFQVKLASHELRLLKPEPEIYARALQQFHCAPHEVVFFDDLLENVRAAQSCGWNAVRIDPSGSPAGQVLDALRALDVNL